MLVGGKQTVTAFWLLPDEGLGPALTQETTQPGKAKATAEG